MRLPRWRGLPRTSTAWVLIVSALLLVSMGFGLATPAQGQGERRVPTYTAEGPRSNPPGGGLSGSPSVPFPRASTERELLANFAYIVSNTSLVEASGVAELRKELRVSRLLKVRSEVVPPGYYVIELSDRGGNPVATAALTREGQFIALEDNRTADRGRPISLERARESVRNRVGPPVGSSESEYVYFVSAAEGGFSVLRPLAAVRDGSGRIVYFNSEGRAFLVAGSDLESSLLGRRSASGRPGVTLVDAGVW